jgi:hypothetical protein
MVLNIYLMFCNLVTVLRRNVKIQNFRRGGKKNGYLLRRAQSMSKISSIILCGDGSKTLSQEVCSVRKFVTLLTFEFVFLRKMQILKFQLTFRGLRPSAQGLVGLVGKLIVDFSITRVEVFSLPRSLQALRLKLCSAKRVFLGVGTFLHKFGDEDSI